jgi:hypothetical protein
MHTHSEKCGDSAFALEPNSKTSFPVEVFSVELLVAPVVSADEYATDFARVASARHRIALVRKSSHPHTRGEHERANG